MNYKSALLIACVAAAVSPAFADPDLSKLPPAATKTEVTYAKDIRPLFEASCVRCHGAERPKAGLHLDSLEGVLKGSKDGKVVESGRSEKSLLVVAVARIDPQTAMPPQMRGGPRRGPGGDQGGPGGPGGPCGQGDPGEPGGKGGPGGPGGPRWPRG